ncbi:MAG TPA: MFS transporter, partial [Nitrococcus sp.]|nr:MFS transporter [Nitrococcus sp.]
AEKGEDAQRSQEPQQPSRQSELAQKEIAESGVKPREDLVLKKDPLKQSLWWAVRYVLKIPTNVLLIIASALGYYFFAGVRAFAMIYVTGHYGLSRSVASGLVIVIGLGGIAGALAGGRLADRLLRRGWLSARVLVPGVGLLLTVIFIAPAVWTTNVPIAVVLLTLGSGMLGAVNPPLDSARLDIMHPRLWGRAESVRITLRMFLEAAAPTVFGLISERVFGGGTGGLKWTFLLMLLPVLVASSLSIPARRSYPRDVATASASLNAGPEGKHRQ